MFVGHYGVSFAVKRGDKTIPLWVLFVAVQLLDVFWGAFVLLGIERVRIVPGTDRLGRFGMPIFGVVMLIVQAVAFFGAPPPSAAVAAVEALVFYAVFAAAAGWLERRRA